MRSNNFCQLDLATIDYRCSLGALHYFPVPPFPCCLPYLLTFPALLELNVGGKVLLSALLRRVISMHHESWRHWPARTAASKSHWAASHRRATPSSESPRRGRTESHGRPKPRTEISPASGRTVESSPHPHSGRRGASSPSPPASKHDGRSVPKLGSDQEGIALGWVFVQSLQLVLLERGSRMRMTTGDGE